MVGGIDIVVSYCNNMVGRIDIVVSYCNNMVGRKGKK
jgi:hypothetical protein